MFFIPTNFLTHKEQAHPPPQISTRKQKNMDKKYLEYIGGVQVLRRHVRGQSSYAYDLNSYKLGKLYSKVIGLVKNM